MLLICRCGFCTGFVDVINFSCGQRQWCFQASTKQNTVANSLWKQRVLNSNQFFSHSFSFAANIKFSRIWSWAEHPIPHLPTNWLILFVCLPAYLFVVFFLAFKTSFILILYLLYNEYNYCTLRGKINDINNIYILDGYSCVLCIFSDCNTKPEPKV